jgi:GNAT superfamily N-acetyltransferase
MDIEYKVVHVEKPEESAWGIIGRGLMAFNKQQAGDDQMQRVCFALQGADGEIAGGILGEIYWDWLYVDLMWLQEELRGRGYGHQLLEQIEAEARQRGVRHAYLDTFSFQAPEFYQQHGYRVFGELKDFPAGHQRYFMTKDL